MSAEYLYLYLCLLKLFHHCLIIFSVKVFHLLYLFLGIFFDAVINGIVFLFFSDSLLFSSVQFSCSVVSDTLWPHELQHTRVPCPSPTPGAYSNSCLSSQWCHPTISSSVVPFSSCLQSFPATGSFKWVSSSQQVVKVLEFQVQHQSFKWIARTDFL